MAEGTTMKKALTAYTMLNFCAVCTGIMIVFLARLPAEDTWNAMFAMAAMAPTTIVSAAITRLKKVSFRII
jgi:hypothetical protein